MGRPFENGNAATQEDLRAELERGKEHLDSHQEDLRGYEKTAKLVENVLAMARIGQSAAEGGARWDRAEERYPGAEAQLLEEAAQLAEEFWKLAGQVEASVRRKIMGNGESMLAEAGVRYAQSAGMAEAGPDHKTLGLLGQILEFEHWASRHAPDRFPLVPWEHVQAVNNLARMMLHDPGGREEHLAAARHPAILHHHARIVRKHAPDGDGPLTT